MNAHSNSGRRSNNRVFSPCSIRQMRMILKYKSSCFVEQTSDRCGNFIVDEGEECDVGPGRVDDQCCTDFCKLRPEAECSDLNDICCNKCKLALEGTLCRSRLPNECLDDAFCSGSTERCPPQRAVADNTTCADRGTCRSGQCVPFCESIGKISCLCKDDAACLRCCQDAPDQNCVPIQPVDRLVDGTLCTDGYCKSGRCKKRVQDVVSRIVSIIKKVSPSWVIERLRRYAVPLVILGLSIIWVPFGIFLHYLDKDKYSFRSVPASRSVSQMLRGGSLAQLNGLNRNSSFVGILDFEPKPGSRPLRVSDL